MAGVRTVANITLHDLFNSDRAELKEFRRLLEQAVDLSFTKNWEYGGAVYATADGTKIKNSGPTTGKFAISSKDSDIRLDVYLKLPDKFTNVVVAYHVHPKPNDPAACKPSGLDKTDGQGDLSNARSTWPASFYLVATGRKEPKNGWNLRDRCEICHEGTTNSGKDYRVWYVYPNWT